EQVDVGFTGDRTVFPVRTGHRTGVFQPDEHMAGMIDGEWPEGRRAVTFPEVAEDAVRVGASVAVEADADDPADQADERLGSRMTHRITGAVRGDEGSCGHDGFLAEPGGVREGGFGRLDHGRVDGEAGTRRVVCQDRVASRAESFTAWTHAHVDGTRVLD